jgi:hypothetical protein
VIRICMSGRRGSTWLARRWYLYSGGRANGSSVPFPQSGTLPNKRSSRAGDALFAYHRQNANLSRFVAMEGSSYDLYTLTVVSATMLHPDGRLETLYSWALLSWFSFELQD